MINCFSQTIKIKEYFFVKQNQIEHFLGSYSLGFNDNNFKNKTKILVPPPPVQSDGRNDSAFDIKETYY